MPYTYDYPMPMVTVDALVFRLTEARPGGGVEVLLIRRRRPPFEGLWAIPGGFVEIDEDLEPAAHRELEEETGLRGVALEQLRTFGRPGRDPRGRTISVAYAGIVAAAASAVQGSDDASEARWFPVDALPPLAFDHDEVLRYGLAWLRGRTGSSRLRSVRDC
jgi:8-oxo-dGTP diphosphatase